MRAIQQVDKEVDTEGFACTFTYRTLSGVLTRVLFCAIMGTSVLAQSETLVVRGRLCALTQVIQGNTVEVEGSTGEAILDRQLAAEAHRLVRNFGFQPGLRILYWPNADNALAVSQTIVPGTQGTVLLGRDMLFKELKENRRGWGGLAVAGIMAHEFAHIFQFFNGYEQRLANTNGTVELMELHADFMAGYHLGLKRKEGRAMDIGAFMDSIYFRGDNKEYMRAHHGRPRERQRAVREGYRLGYQQAPSIDKAARIGVELVRKIARTQL
jgi:hypothetical protein